MRREIEGQGVHVGEIRLEELQLGDSIVFGTVGEDKFKKKASVLGWEYMTSIDREAAEIILMREHSKSVFNSRGNSSSGQIPSKMAEWEIGFGVVHEFTLRFAYEEQAVVLCRAAKDHYVLIRSREARHTDRFKQ